MDGYPRIKRPTDPELIEKLKNKLQEYKERKDGKGTQWEMKPPSLAHQNYGSYRDACYKFEVLKAVLESNAPVDTFELTQKMLLRYGKNFNVKEFMSAAKVISSHCGDTSITLVGGTGLPEAKG